MYCKNCGTKLNEGDKVCSKCNTPVVSNNTTQSSGKNPFLHFLKHELILIGITVAWFVLITLIAVTINIISGGARSKAVMHRPSEAYRLFKGIVLPILQIIIPMLSIMFGWIPILIHDIVKNS